MNKLQLFLIENEPNETLYEYVVSNRFVDENGNKMPFKVKPLNGEDYMDYQKRSTNVGKDGAKFDTKRFQELIILNNVVDPNFKDSEFVKAAGCKTPSELLYKVLKAGEISRLSDYISKISGYDESTEESEIEEVKNS